MRILHTSDWHVGKTLRGRSRAPEHEAVLAEVAAVAAAEAADLVLVVGDLFDSAAPSPESERIVYRALLDLARVAPVVVVAGNHDNERRLQAVEPLLGLGRIVTAAELRRPADGGVVTIESAVGERARVALMPFLSQSRIVRADELMSGEAADHAQEYAQRARRLLEQLSSGFEPGAINLIAAHLMVQGGAVGGGERLAQTIFDYQVPSQAFPASAHYVALGHLHRAQRIPGPCPVHYCGSPLHLDFGEAAGPRSVNLVEAAPGRPVEVRAVELLEGRRLRTLRGTLPELRLLAGSTGADYLRVYVNEPPRLDLADDVRELFPEAVDVIVDSPAAAAAPRPQRSGKSPHELFAEYLAERDATDERLTALFAQVWEEVAG